MPFMAFWSFWEWQINETNYFLWTDFFLSQRNSAYIKTQLYRPYSCTKNQFFGGFLIESFILPTLNKLLQKSRLKPIANSCIWNGLQLDRLNVAIISVQGMPLSSLRMSDGAAASEDKFRDNRRPCECCIAVTVSLRHGQILRQPKGSLGAWGERGFSTM